MICKILSEHGAQMEIILEPENTNDQVFLQQLEKKKFVAKPHTEDGKLYNVCIAILLKKGNNTDGPGRKRKGSGKTRKKPR